MRSYERPRPVVCFVLRRRDRLLSACVIGQARRTDARWRHQGAGDDRFLQRLIKNARRKVFLILDRLPVHRAAVVREWLAKHKAKIEVSYLPSCSPDKGFKQHVTCKAPMCSKQQLKQAAISHMRRLAKSPARVRSYFRQKPVRDAA